MNTFAEYLNPVIPYILKELISNESFKEIKKSASILPSDMAFTTFGFECILNNDIPKADFLISLISDSGSVALSSLNLTGSLKKNKVWKDIIEFGKAWNDPDNFLYNKVNNVWLEFDITRKNLFIPSIFFSPLNENQNVSENKKGYPEILEKVLNILLEKNVYNNLKDKLSECINKLPSGCSVFQVGIMKARPTKYVRLCVSVNKPGEISEYLNSISYKGNLEKLNCLINRYLKFSNKVCIDFDVADDVSDKLGIEYYIETKSIAAKEEKWKIFLEELFQNNYCTEKKTQGLIEYMGYSSIKDNEGLWPNNLKEVYSLMKKSKTSFFVRTLHHVKIVFNGTEATEAKAYLAVNHIWK